MSLPSCRALSSRATASRLSAGKTKRMGRARTVLPARRLWHLLPSCWLRSQVVRTGNGWVPRPEPLSLVAIQFLAWLLALGVKAMGQTHRFHRVPERFAAARAAGFFGCRAPFPRFRRDRLFPKSIPLHRILEAKLRNLQV